MVSYGWLIDWLSVSTLDPWYSGQVWPHKLIEIEWWKQKLETKPFKIKQPRSHMWSVMWVSFNQPRVMAKIACFNRLNSTVTISCAADSRHWLFFPCFFLFWNTKHASQPKNEKSTAPKTRPTLVEKMAVLEKIYAAVSRCVFVLATVS